MKFTTVEAQVISPKNYVMEGDSFRASISIAPLIVLRHLLLLLLMYL